MNSANYVLIQVVFNLIQNQFFKLIKKHIIK